MQAPTPTTPTAPSACDGPPGRASAQRAARVAGTRARRSDRGEGVISTAIAVLIVAFLGVAMWAGFKTIFDDAATTTRNQVQMVGR